MANDEKNFLRLLIVDDEPDITRLLSWFLQKEPFRIRVANSGKAALEAIAQEPAELIVTDVRMPEIDGMELARRVIALSPYTRIIIMTGHGDMAMAVEAMRLGAVDFLRKPFGMEEARAAIHAAAKKWREEETRRLTEIDTAAKGRDGDAEDNSQTKRFGFSRAISNYRVLRVIGEGNIGIVFLCERLSDQRQFALKLLKAKTNRPDYQEAVFNRFIHEGNAISQLNHPNIVRFIEFGRGDADNNHSPYIVMEYCPGKSLKSLILEKAPLRLEDKIVILRQVASALAAVHAKNILHRDIKPDNIIIDKDLKVKVTDFGVCHLPSSDLTSTTDLVGTPCYLAPEYLLQGRVGPTTDIYSWGVVAYELLLGVRPYDYPTVSDFIGRIRREYPIEPRKIDPKFPIPLQDILAKALRKKPKNRFQSADRILTDLDNLAAGKIENNILKRLARNFSERDWR